MPGNGTSRRHKREQILCDLLREGVPVARAAPAVGLHPTTITYWAWQGRSGNTAYGRFAAAYRDARLEREHRVDELLEDARDRLNGH